MKRLFLTVIVALTWMVYCSAQDTSRPATNLPPIEVHFSPKGGCTEAVVKEIGEAKTEILVQAYSFTSVPIAKALIDANKRNVKIQVILDSSQRTAKYSSADFVRNAGIPTFIDSKHAIAHNKIIIIDGQIVITGSFNFTKQAETSNAENLLVIRDKEIADKYAANWKTHAEHSDPYEQKEKGYSETHETAETPPAATEGYVASKNSSVFHRADCKSATKISEKNLVHYTSRDEAIQVGKKPCAECNP